MEFCCGWDQLSAGPGCVSREVVAHLWPNAGPRKRNLPRTFGGFLAALDAFFLSLQAYLLSTLGDALA